MKNLTKSYFFINQKNLSKIPIGNDNLNEVYSSNLNLEPKFNTNYKPYETKIQISEMDKKIETENLNLEKEKTILLKNNLFISSSRLTENINKAIPKNSQKLSNESIKKDLNYFTNESKKTRNNYKSYNFNSKINLTKSQNYSKKSQQQTSLYDKKNNSKLIRPSEENIILQTFNNEYNNTKTNENDRNNSLYMFSKVKKENKTNLEKEMRDKRINDELEKCTFNPKVTPIRKINDLFRAPSKNLLNYLKITNPKDSRLSYIDRLNSWNTNQKQKY